MLKLIKQYRFYLILLLFLLIPLLSIDTVNRSPRDYRAYDRIALAITTPFEIAIHWTLDTLFGVYQNYLSLWNTRKENRALLDENRKLVNTILNLRELEQENIRFRDLLRFKETYKVDTVLARIIAKDVSTEFRTLRINRGRQSGIEPNMAVINAEGVVGRILRVSEDTSDVVSILDPLSAIDSLIKVTRKSYGITQKVEVKPSVDFSKVEEVLVVTHTDPAPVHAQLVEAPLKPVQKPVPGKP